MKPLQTTKRYDAWLLSINDATARLKIVQRTGRARQGNLGDHKGVGNGVIELRIHYGPGYRVYLTQRHGELIILLGGGTKKTQKADILQAIALAETY